MRHIWKVMAVVADNDKNLLDRKYWLLYLLSGLIFMGCATLFFVEYAVIDAEKSLSQLNGFIRKQVLVYTQHNNLSMAKDISNISVLGEEISREISKGRLVVTDETLVEYGQSMWLDGIIVMDERGSIDAHYNREGVPYSSLLYLLNKEAVRNVAWHPEKIYTDIITDRYGQQFALAAVWRPDKPGVIVCYHYTSKDDAQQQNLTIQKLLASYGDVDMGTIVISDGDKILASNNEKLINTSVQNSDHIQNLLSEAKPGKLVLMDMPGQPWNYGLYNCGRNFFVYIFVPTERVFATLPRNLLLSLIFWLAAVSVVQLFRMHAINRMRRTQDRLDEQYKKELEASAYKAEAANRTKTEFLQRMSHDIRTPINGIKGMVEVADYYAGNEEKQAECRRKIAEASEILLELVNEVLDMGKLESGEIYLESRPIDLEQMLDTLVDILEKQAGARGITIHKHVVLRHKNILGSRGHIKRLFMNLMSNAVKYNKDNGKVFINCRETGCDEDMVHIEFVCRDTGVGMSPEFQKHAFDAFSREQGEHTKGVSGTGLGMSIAKNLAEKMGGSLTFTSEPEKGTTMIVKLPLKLDPEAGEQHAFQEEQEVPADEINLNGVNLLLVEDNELNMEIAEFILGSVGANYTKAMNGQEAVDIFSRSPAGTFDGILMDVMMPVMNGYEAAEAIRKLHRDDAKRIPIIAMTANAFTDDKRRAYEAGMNEHLAKPLDKELLLRTLVKFCKR